MKFNRPKNSPANITFMFTFTLLIGTNLAQVETLIVRKFADRSHPCFKAATAFETRIIHSEGYGGRIMKHGEEIQQELESYSYDKTYRDKYHSRFELVIEAGEKITQDPHDQAIFDFDIGHPYQMYLEIENEREKLIDEKCFDIFKVSSITKHCTIHDLGGFSDLYKPIIKHYIENKVEDDQSEMLECELHKDNKKGSQKKKASRKVSCFGNILKSNKKRKLII